jgi:hypothetical protein
VAVRHLADRRAFNLSEHDAHIWLSLVLLALGDDVGEWMADLFR